MVAIIMLAVLQRSGLQTGLATMAAAVAIARAIYGSISWTGYSSNHTEYQDLKAQLEVYTSLLDVRLDEVRAEVDALEQQAQELISLYAKDTARTSTSAS